MFLAEVATEMNKKKNSQYCNVKIPNSHQLRRIPRY
jgi:hypothetical protein